MGFGKRSVPLRTATMKQIRPRNELNAIASCTQPLVSGLSDILPSLRTLGQRKQVVGLLAYQIPVEVE